MPFPKIEVSAETREASIREELDAFDQFFQKELKNEPLVRVEAAILRTYLFWKTRTEKTNAE